MSEKSKALAAHYQHTKDCPICEQEWGELEQAPPSPVERQSLDVMISVRLSRQDAARIRRTAASLGMGVSDFARLMLRRAAATTEQTSTLNLTDGVVASGSAG